MRILLVHNFYGSLSPSGENRVVLEERDLLRAAGHEIIEHFTYSDTIRDRGLFPMVSAGVFVPWNPFARKRLRVLVRELEPHIMHVHNVFPLLSPAILDTASRVRTAVVNTLHNYRTVCPASVPLRNGVACTRCVDTRSVGPALWHGCYRNSRLATIPLAASTAVHRRLDTYARHVDAFIALTAFQKSVLVHGGLPEERIYVKPNCLPSVPRLVPWCEREDKAVFLGRISTEKGLDILIEAWVRWGCNAPKLEIIGDGPEFERVRGLVPAASADRIVFVGRKPAGEAQALLSTAKLLIVPSTWFEGFPLSLCEAFAFGVPVAASRFGTFEELVGSPGVGRLFTPGDAESLRETTSALWADEVALQRMSNAARHEFETRYTAQKSVAALQNIYKCAIDTKRARLHNVGKAIVAVTPYGGAAAD